MPSATKRRYHSRAHRIQGYIADELQKVGLALDENGAEASLEEMADAFVPPVEALGVHPIDLLHPTRQVRHGRLDEQVIVVAHETVRVNFPTEPLYRSAKDT